MTLEELRAKLGVAPPDESIRWLNILPYGEPGVGKTVFAGTVEDDPERLMPCLYLDIDGGIVTNRKRRGLEVKQVRSERQMRAIHQLLYDSVDWEAEDPQVPYKTVVIDTISELAKLMMRQLMKETHRANPKQNEYVPSQREYLINGEQMRDLIRDFRDLPCHTIFCCHSGDGKDNSNATIYFPQFSGKLRHEIAGFIDIVGYMTADKQGEETKRFMQVVKTKRVAGKDRTNALGDGIENPTLPGILDAIEADNKLIKP